MKTPSSTRYRSVIMQHLRTGRIISAPTVAEFTRRAKLKKLARLQFDDVFKGKKLTLYGWGEARTLNRPLVFKDVFGNRYEGTVAQLRRKGLSATAINRLMRGRTQGSLAPLDHDYGPILPLRTRLPMEYTLQRDGQTIRGQTLAQVAREAGIHYMGAFDLVHGNRQTVKGVSLMGVKTRQRHDPIVARVGLVPAL